MDEVSVLRARAVCVSARASIVVRSGCARARLVRAAVLARRVGNESLSACGLRCECLLLM
jgi:hypothetical protein